MMKGLALWIIAVTFLTASENEAKLCMSDKMASWRRGLLWWSCRTSWPLASVRTARRIWIVVSFGFGEGWKYLLCSSGVAGVVGPRCDFLGSQCFRLPG
jgi:hypothetical protein